MQVIWGKASIAHACMQQCGVVIEVLLSGFFGIPTAKKMQMQPADKAPGANHLIWQACLEDAGTVSCPICIKGESVCLTPIQSALQACTVSECFCALLPISMHSTKSCHTSTVQGQLQGRCSLYIQLMHVTLVSSGWSCSCSYRH